MLPHETTVGRYASVKYIYANPSQILFILSSGEIWKYYEILINIGICSRDSVLSQGTYSTAKSKAKERNSVPCFGRCVREITWMFAVKQNNLPNGISRFSSMETEEKQHFFHICA